MPDRDVLRKAARDHEVVTEETFQLAYARRGIPRDAHRPRAANPASGRIEATRGDRRSLGFLELKADVVDREVGIALERSCAGLNAADQLEADPVRPQARRAKAGLVIAVGYLGASTIPEEAATVAAVPVVDRGNVHLPTRHVREDDHESAGRRG